MSSSHPSSALGGPPPSAAAASPAVGTPPPAKKVKVSDKDVELKHAPRGVWLVKVPNYVADRWEKCPDGAPVATLSIHKEPHKKPKVTLSLADEVTAARLPNSSVIAKNTSGKIVSNEASGGMTVLGGARSSTNQQIPTEHALMVSTPNSQTLAVFSALKPTDEEKEAGRGDKLAMEGRVVQRADCRPVNNKTYMSVKKEAILKAIEPTRKAVKLDRVEMSYKPVSNHKANIEHERMKKERGKKSRDDKEVVMEKLFALFEKHQYYNIRDLEKETRQPITYLKEILNECCKYRVSNPHKHTWELKEEYRHYKAPEGAAAEGEKKEGSDSSDEEME